MAYLRAKNYHKHPSTVENILSHRKSVMLNPAMVSEFLVTLRAS